jgi:hypothetical protein
MSNMTKSLFVLTFVGLLASPMLAAGKKTKTVVVSDQLLNAICMVESGCDPNVADGDNGNSIGRLQISLPYFTDAKEFDKTINFPYENCRTDYEKSQQVVRSYMARYAPDRATNEQIARIHNAGPKALTEKRIRLTDGYWKKVKEALAQ